LVRPDNVINNGPEVQIPWILSGVEVTVYLVIGNPPSLVGAAHEMSAEEALLTANRFLGAPGFPLGITVLDCTEDGPVPNAFVALTLKM